MKDIEIQLEEISKIIFLNAGNNRELDNYYLMCGNLFQDYEYLLELIDCNADVDEITDMQDTIYSCRKELNKLIKEYSEKSNEYKNLFDESKILLDDIENNLEKISNDFIDKQLFEE